MFSIFAHCLRFFFSSFIVMNFDIQMKWRILRGIEAKHYATAEECGSDFNWRGRSSSLRIHTRNTDNVCHQLERKNRARICMKFYLSSARRNKKKYMIKYTFRTSRLWMYVKYKFTFSFSSSQKLDSQSFARAHS